MSTVSRAKSSARVTRSPGRLPCLLRVTLDFLLEGITSAKRWTRVCTSRKGRRRPRAGLALQKPCEGGSGMLTPNTFLAPAFAANMERIPVPLPTSSTTLSLNTCLLWYMEFRYVSVRTSSFSISCMEKKKISMYSRYLAAHQGHGLQNCPTKFFKDLDDVTRQATEEHHGVARPVAACIITNNSRPKTLPTKDSFVLSKEN